MDETHAHEPLRPGEFSVGNVICKTSGRVVWLGLRGTLPNKTSATRLKQGDELESELAAATRRLDALSSAGGAASTVSNGSSSAADESADS